MYKLLLSLFIFTNFGCSQKAQNNNAEVKASHSRQESVDFESENLIRSIRENEYLDFKLNLSEGADVNFVKDQETALNLAIKLERVPMIKMLIEAGADVNAKSPLDTYSPLVNAILLKNTIIANTLIEAGSDINEDIQTNSDNLSILELAITHKLDMIVKKVMHMTPKVLLDEIEVEIISEKLKENQLERYVPLAKTIKEIYQKDISAQFFEAVVFDYYDQEVINYILSNFDIEEIINGRNILARVIQLKDLTHRNIVLTSLLNNGFPANQLSKDTLIPIIEAARLNDVEALSQLYLKEADLEQSNEQGQSALMIATLVLNVEAVDYLYSKRAKKYYQKTQDGMIIEYDACDLIPPWYSPSRRFNDSINEKAKAVISILDC